MAENDANQAQTDEERVRKCLMFDDGTYYLHRNCYFDVAGQVHSVVETKIASCVLRIWRGETMFGPKQNEYRFEHNMFHVTGDSFKRYIVKPDIHIGKTVKKYGTEHLLEIVVYDEHQESLKGIYSGDYVAVQNVHHSTKYGFLDCLVIHGSGQEKHNRGISLIPEPCLDPAFRRLEAAVDNALLTVTDYFDFVEFVEEKEIEKEVVKDINAPTDSVSGPSGEAPEVQKPCEAEENEFAKPWNRIVIGDVISVDYFIKSSKCKYHFLTHGHTDHCGGIDLKWPHKIFCSEKTADILPIILNVEPEKIREGMIIPLKENQRYEMEGFTVTAIHANHVHGAVMFVFEGPLIQEITKDGVGRILCTGDFRGSENWIKQLKCNQEYKWLFTSKFSRIYLDNTYFSVDEKFLTLEEAAVLMRTELSRHPSSDFYIPSHRLGREELLEKVALSLREPLNVFDEKMKIAKKANCVLNLDVKKERTIHVVKRNKWKGPPQEKDVYIMEITMLHHLVNTSSAQNVIRIPYSEHSSRQEILEFLKLFEFDAIYPSSKKYSKKDFKEMMRVGRGFTEEKLERQLHLHDFIQSNGQQSPLPPGSTKTDQVKVRPLPPYIMWQNDEYEYMTGDLDIWPEGPPKTEEEAVFRMSNRKRRRVSLPDDVQIAVKREVEDRE